jgi:hypothetical protein
MHDARVLIPILVIALSFGSPEQAAAPAAGPSVKVTGLIYQPDGRTSAASSSGTVSSRGSVWFVTTGDTLCEAQAIGRERPAVAGNGWRLELKPAPASARTNAMPRNALLLRASIQRLWEGGVEVPNAPVKDTIVAVPPGAPLSIDVIDGGGRALTRKRIDALKRLGPEDLGLEFPEFANDTLLVLAARTIATLEAEQKRLTAQEGLGANNARMVAITAQLNDQRAVARARRHALTQGLLAQYEARSPLPLVNGCAALSMHLVLTRR